MSLGNHCGFYSRRTSKGSISTFVWGWGGGEKPPYCVRQMLHCTCRRYSLHYLACVSNPVLIIIVIVSCANHDVHVHVSLDHVFDIAGSSMLSSEALKAFYSLRARCTSVCPMQSDEHTAPLMYHAPNTPYSTFLLFPLHKGSSKQFYSSINCSLSCVPSRAAESQAKVWPD